MLLVGITEARCWGACRLEEIGNSRGEMIAKRKGPRLVELYGRFWGVDYSVVYVNCFQG